MAKSGNNSLNKAKKLKFDEFYTSIKDIKKEVKYYYRKNEDIFRDKTIFLPCDNPWKSNFTNFFTINFESFGLKRIISSGYSAHGNGEYCIWDREYGEPFLSKVKEYSHNGDFRSPEVTSFLKESDFVITNPPFSLFREFFQWLINHEKKFLILGNLNTVTHKNIFPLIRDQKVCLGFDKTIKKYFRLPNGDFYSLGNTIWLTNIMPEIPRNKSLALNTMEWNLKNNKKLINKLPDNKYQKYDNYDAINIPLTNAIPSDYQGVMGVPVSFMQKYNPDQFLILGSSVGLGQDEDGIYGRPVIINGKEVFKRIFIQHRKQ